MRLILGMDTIDILNREFFTQDFAEEHPYRDLLEIYKDVARNYARMEKTIAVLSDLRENASYIYYGGFARTLGLGQCGDEGELSSIWEKEIFRLVHPDDLAAKHLHELYFYQFIKRQPKGKRADYYLASRLRMKSVSNDYIPVLHRMFYVTVPSDGTLWLALCLYGPLAFDITSQCVIVDSVSGRIVELDDKDSTRILSPREKEVLGLIGKGYTSKQISEMLFISVNTVSRHRQEILGKLQVKNSIEACRVAEELKLI